MAAEDTIRNKGKLVKRAQDHYEQDRFLGGTYGHYHQGVFGGCAIGCLATPASKTEMVAWFEERMRQVGADPERQAYTQDGERQVEEIHEEFGICATLMRECESVFESLGVPENAQFVVDFARAVPEGVEVTSDMVRAFREDRVKRIDAEMEASRYGSSELMLPDRHAEDLINWLLGMAKPNRVARKQPAQVAEVQGVKVNT